MSVQIAHYRPVSAGVSIRADTVAWDDGVAVVGAAGATARYREDTAHTEGGGAGARGGAALARAFYTSILIQKYNSRNPFPICR